MSLWSRISEVLSALAKGAPLSEVFAYWSKPPEQTVAFTIAVIALGAKMAKADGHVTRSEVQAFQQVFHIPPEALDQAARVFDLARQDVSGYEHYAKRIGAMFGSGSKILEDLLEGLFHIATADDDYHPKENVFLEKVADLFGLEGAQFQSIRARCVNGYAADPYTILGASQEDAFPIIKAKWQALVRDSHPDLMIARGVPAEAVKLAEKRLIRVNEAFEKIKNTKS